MMGLRIKVSRFRLYQLKRILEIERASFPEGPFQREMFRDLYRNCADLFFVARLSGRIAGYIVTCSDGERAEIVSIAVDPKYRNTGVGRALMQHMLDKLVASGVRQLDLMVRPTNREGVRLYRSLGFSRFKKVTDYYEDGGDAVWMRKNL
jgi:ribosomal-protein-alanine N-acetyltransferase